MQQAPAKVVTDVNRRCLDFRHQELNSTPPKSGKGFALFKVTSHGGQGPLPLPGRLFSSLLILSILLRLIVVIVRTRIQNTPAYLLLLFVSLISRTMLPLAALLVSGLVFFPSLEFAEASLPAYREKDGPIRIFLDPGHGGRDDGVVHERVREADIVLDFVKSLRERLMKDQQFEIKLSRETDKSVSLQSRVEKATATRADLLLSFHVNSTPDQRANGIELFFRFPLPADSASTNLERVRHDLRETGRLKRHLILARALRNSLKENEKTFGKTRIHIKQAPFYVLTKTETPSLLIELGFLTHPREREKLLQRKYRDELAEQIVFALVSFSNLMKETRDKNSPRGLE